MSNLQTIKVGATTPARQTTVLISGTTHAAYIQKVNVRIQDANGHVTTHTFEGSGEGTPFNNPLTMNAVPLPLTAQFEFLYSFMMTILSHPSHIHQGRRRKKNLIPSCMPKSLSL